MPAVQSGTMDITEMYDKYGAGVVRVDHDSGLGSGFVIDKEGHILTNAHVVDGAQGSISVSFSNNERVEAKVIGVDNATDVAVLKVDVPASALTVIPLGSSSDLQVGSPVVAIGNPFGQDRTVTSGIISAMARQIQAPNGFAINGAIQTDAAINHGNSGGPLLDMNGKVIGINSQIDTGGTGDGNVGIGFAVPVDLVKQVTAELMATGKAQHAWLGVQLTDVDPTLASQVKIGSDYGAMIAGVARRQGRSDGRNRRGDHQGQDVRHRRRRRHRSQRQEDRERRRSPGRRLVRQARRQARADAEDGLGRHQADHCDPRRPAAGSHRTRRLSYSSAADDNPGGVGPLRRSGSAGPVCGCGCPTGV
jgi:S1-C subfamily serine protease